MAKALRHIDVSGIPELLRIAEEVGSSGEARVLRKDNRDLAMVAPLPPLRSKSRRKLSAEARKAFLSAAGGWKDVDTDRLVSDIYASRRIGDRPPVSL